MSHISIGFAQMDYLEDVYQQKKASRSMNDATYHYMEGVDAS
jgi:hypothetical protein